MKAPNPRPASDRSSEIFFLFHPKLSVSNLSKLSVDVFVICEPKDCQLNKNLTSSSRRITQYYHLRSKPSQSLSFSRTRSASCSIFARLSHYAQLHLSTFDKLPISPFDTHFLRELSLVLKLLSLLTQLQTLHNLLHMVNLIIH